MKRLPNGWCTTSITEVILKMANGTTAKQNKEGIGTPVTRIETIAQGLINFDKVGFIDADAALVDKYSLQKGDILFSHINSDTHLGKTALYEEDRCLLHGMNLLLIRCNPTAVDYKFLHFLSIFYRTRGFFIEIANKSVNQSSINQKNLCSLSIPLPPLKEQRRIVAKIEELTAHSKRARAALEEVPTLIEQFKQSVLAAAFRGDLTAEWREKNPDMEPAEKLLERIRDERHRKWEEAELEKMQAKGKEPKDNKWKKRYKAPPITETLDIEKFPKTWTNITLHEIAEATANSLAIGPFGSNLKVVDYRTAGIPLVFVREIRAEEFGDMETKFVSLKKADELKSHTVFPGDLLITKMGDPPGDTAVYPLERPTAVITADCIKLSPDEQISSSTFLKYWLRARAVKDEILKETKGVAQQKLSLKRFRNITVPVPPVEEQKVILTHIENHFRSIAEILSLSSSLYQDIDLLDQSILAKAFRGELVPQDPNDEPAAVLLERIRAEREKLEAAKKKKKRSARKKAK